MLKRSKKGFTLAELLIVVAIIAVLTAIAVPLFVSSLSKAQKATDDANIRAVRGSAVIAILSADEPTDVSGTTTTDNVYTMTGTKEAKNIAWELKGPWVATGTIDGKGNLTNVTVNLASTVEGMVGEDGNLTDKAVDGVSGSTVTVYITLTNLPK